MTFTGLHFPKPLSLKAKWKSLDVACKEINYKGKPVQIVSDINLLMYILLLLLLLLLLLSLSLSLLLLLLLLLSLL